MISLISANLIGIAVGVIAAAVVIGGFGIYYGRKIYAKKHGRSSGCCGDCSSCCGCGFPMKNKDKQTQDK